MTLLALGLNHSTAPLGIRERVNFAPETLPEALRALHRLEGVQEGALLSTCNRTEVYCSLHPVHDAAPYRWFCDWHTLDAARMDDYCYRHQDLGAVRHMLRVASGLDSMVLGEPQILGQLKRAYRSAVGAGSIGNLLTHLFQHSFRVAKQIRNNTAIGDHPISVAFAAVRLARQIFGELGPHTALLIGAGEFTELAARHLRENSLGRMIFANRTLERSQRLAEQLQGYAIPFASIPAHLPEADIVLSSTASQLPILGKGALERALRQRKHRPMLLLDMALPRDIEAEAGQLQDVYLYTVDDLRDTVRDGLHSRRAAAQQAEAIIDTQVLHFRDWLHSLDAVGTIRALRAQAEQFREQVVQGALQKLRAGADPERLLQDTARSLSRKLMHGPTARLRDAGSEGREDLLEACRELFLLEDEPVPPVKTPRG